MDQSFNCHFQGKKVGLALPRIDRLVRLSLPMEGGSASPRLRWIDPLALTFVERRVALARLRWINPLTVTFRVERRVGLARLRWINPLTITFREGKSASLCLG